MHATPAPIIVSNVSDAQTVKQWAAEDLAIALGLLHECPYHGQPFNAHSKVLTGGALAAALLKTRHPSTALFAGNTRELLTAVDNATKQYGERCSFCVAGDEDALE
ncbi:MAG: hypothetical protein V4637_07125 [Pseudomonadota bacterium]